MTKLLFYFIACFIRQRIGKIDADQLAGQTWRFEQGLNSGGFGGGQTWTFLPENNFTATEWYSGGAFWTHHFSGKYHYEIKSKTVYLNNDRNQLIAADSVRKIALKLNISRWIRSYYLKPVGKIKQDLNL